MGYLLCDVALNGENFLILLIVCLCPDMLVVAGIDQLCGDADLVPRTADASFQHNSGIELLPDLPDRLRCLLILHDGGPGNDLEIGNLGELCQDILSYAVAEEFRL